MPASIPKELELSHLDQQPHIRVYGRYYIIFPFPDRNYAAAAEEALRTGFKEVLRRFPYLAGTVDILSRPSSERLRVRYHDPIDLDAEARRIFTTSHDDAQHDYDSLAKDDFAPGQLPATVYCPLEVKNHAGLGTDAYAEKMINLQQGPIPAYAAHATFIPGGLVLSVWFYHAVLDGTGTARVQKVWSDAVRALNSEKGKVSHIGRFHPLCRAPSYKDQLDLLKDMTEQGNDNSDPSHRLSRVPSDRDQAEPLGDMTEQCNDISDPSTARRALTTLAERADTSETCADTSRHMMAERYELRKGPDEGPNEVVTEMFRFSSSTINKSLDELINKTGKRMSHFTILAAIIWSNVVHARSTSLAASGNAQSTLAVVVDLRRFLFPPFSDPDYLGNLVLSAMPTLSLEKYTVSVEDLATKIADALQALNTTWTETQLGSVHANPGKTQHSLLKFPRGPDLYITSWQRMGADYEWYIPGTSSPNATAIRRAAWVSEGGVVVLPREHKKDEPYEIMISLTKSDMKRFADGLNSGGWLVDSVNDRNDDV
jgi:BAHD acyltransferase